MFSNEKISFREFLRRHQIGIYTTIMFHLIVLGALMLSSMHTLLTPETRILIDFSTQQQIEQLEKLEQIKEAAQQQVNELLANAKRPQELRNVAVDASEQLRDDRNTNAKELYDEAQRVQDRLDAARQAQREQSAQSDEPALPQQADKKTEAYKGPSVLSYDLGGRRAVRLPVPVYQCDGGGDVTVNIEVSRQGRVTGATIQANVSTNNTCLHEAAIRAALLSRFVVKADAPDPQKGHIVYRFIAQ